MPTPGKSRKAVRMDDDLWERFGQATEAAGLDRSTVLRDFVIWYVDETDRVTYRRPAPKPAV